MEDWTATLLRTVFESLGSSAAIWCENQIVNLDLMFYPTLVEQASTISGKLNISCNSIYNYGIDNDVIVFRVTAVCGDFYIGGRQFDSLSDLVGYYTSYADLLKKERLAYPVAPPEPVNDKKRVVAILPYTKMPDTDELTFQKGDIFFVHNDMGDGWLWVTAHRTGEQGLVFQDLVEHLDQAIDPNKVFNWFHDNISKEAAVDLLVKGNIFIFSVWKHVTYKL